MKKQWPVRKQLIQGDNNITNQPLLSRNRIILPPNQVRIDETIRESFRLKRSLFCLSKRSLSWLSSEKLKAGIFDGPQIRKLIKDRTFSLDMTKVQQDAWNPYVLVVKEFPEAEEQKTI